MTRTHKAELLRKLHAGPEILVVPNAWDAISARVIEADGFPVIATTSLAVDLIASGEMMPLAAILEAICAVRAVGEAQGVPLVINARTDIFLAKHGEESSRFDRVVERLNAFHDAGADCLFAPGIADAEAIGRLAAAVTGPSRIAIGGLQRFLRVFRSEGTFAAPAKEAPGCHEVQKLLSHGQ
jgi:2-methylisocitrate lyase-like PEP mutase family enzyme